MHLDARTWLLVIALLQHSGKGLGSLRERDSASVPSINYSWAYANPRYVKKEQKPVTPGALDYTHMGMLTVLPSGELAAAWQGAPVFWEGSRDQGVYLARSTDAGQSWSRATMIVAPKQTPTWAPVLHVQGKRTWLFYSESRPQCWWWGEGGLHWACGGDLKLVTSDNSGATWSDPELVFSFDDEGGIAKMVANKVVVGPKGAWLLPFWREMGGHDCTDAPEMHGKAGVLISKDQGQSWRKADISLDPSSRPTWLIEASISGCQLDGGDRDEFVQLFRTQAGRIYISRSADGRVWTPAIPTILPNPNSKIDSMEMPDGSILLVFNDDTAKRSALTLASSRDCGNTWQRLLVLEDDPNGSFSYPTLQYLEKEELVLVIYSVAYPPQHKSSWLWAWVIAGLEWLSSNLSWAMRALGWSGSRLGKEQLHPEAFTGSNSTLDLGAQQNAWGADAYGLRVASVPASLLQHQHMTA